MQLGNTFYEFALLLAAAGVLGFLAHWLKQPLIVAFIAVGILVGPAGLKWVTIGSEIDLLAKTGIALLLFTVGLKLDLQVIRTMGPVSLATGVGQVIFTSVIGYVICLGLGLSHIASVYVAVALTFSSTIIIVKLLSDKREIDSLHGRIAVGFLIVQDLVVVLVMIALTAFGAGQGSDWMQDILVVAGKGIGLLIVVGLLMRFVLPWIFRRAARSTELLTALAIAWAVSLSAIGDWLGFSKEVGAFLAGVSLAPMPHREALASRLVGLRDFLLLFFFVDLGAHLKLSMLGAQIMPSLALSGFVLIGNPLIVMVIMGAMGYRKRTGFLAGLTVAQISEFSLMLGALGKNLGHIGGDVLGLITLVGLVTITLSTYLIIYSHPLYDRLAPILSWFERKNPYREVELKSTTEPARGFDMIVFGLGRFGNHISRELTERGKRVLGVDFDPDLVHRLRGAGHSVVYGDAEDPEFASTLPLSHARWVVSSVPQVTVNLALLQALSRHGFSGRVATTAHHDRDAVRLKDAGSELVLLPFLDAAKEAVDELCERLESPAKRRIHRFDSPSGVIIVLRFVTHLFAFASWWALLTEARPEAWLVGGPVVVAAAVTSVLLASRQGWRWSVVGFLRFAPHFVCSSFLGGLDVAWRSLHPRLPIDPRLIEYELRLPEGTARVFLMNVVNLLPGTVSADVCDDELLVHVIDGTQPIHQQLAKLEKLVAGLFATQLEPRTEDGESLV